MRYSDFNGEFCEENLKIFCIHWLQNSNSAAEPQLLHTLLWPISFELKGIPVM
jgi:hypothetical protein